MTQVTLTMTFASEAEAAAFLAGKPAPAAATPAPTPTPKADAPAPKPAATSKPSAEAAPAAAPATKALDFKKDVVDGALLPYSKKASRDDFAALMAKYSVSKVPELSAKPEVWAEIIEHCNA